VQDTLVRLDNGGTERSQQPCLALVDKVVIEVALRPFLRWKGT